MNVIRVLTELFLSFFRIGISSFGGLSMIPLINSEMITHGWMTASEVSDIVAIAEMTPGPMGLNCATFAGMRVMSLPGALAANLGVLLPTFTICAAAAVFFEKFRSAKSLKNIMKGVRPVCIGLILAVVIDLSGTNYMIGGTVSPLCIAGGVLSAYLLFGKKLSIPLVITAAAVFGLLFIR